MKEEKNIYVGNRYVPKIMGTWNNQEPYEGLSIVLYEGNSFTSKKNVPSGIDIKNEDFWSSTGNYNVQIENYRQEVKENSKKIDDYSLKHKIELDKNAKKTNGYIVLSDFCKDLNDSIGFLEAVNFAKKNKKSILVDGSYTIDTPIVIENETIPSIFGNGREESVLIFNHSTGYAIETQTYYSKPLKIHDLTIRAASTNKNISCLKVDNGQWGGSIDLNNVNIEYFTEILLNIKNGTQCLLKNVMLNGGLINSQKKATLLQVNYSEGIFSNLNNFENVTFFNGKTALQDFGGTLSTFNNCIFENLDLFCNIVKNTTLSQKYVFNNCWFEKISKGIINAEMSTNLEIVKPIANKANILDNFTFLNCYNGGLTPEFFLDNELEPTYYDNFNVNSGFPIWYFEKTIPLLNDWKGNLKVSMPEKRKVLVQGRIVAGKTEMDTLLGVLPEGYRHQNINFSTSIINASYQKILMGILIKTNGEIVYKIPEGITSGDSVDINFSFDIK